MWICDNDSEFTKWQHPAMWYVALRWHAIEFAQWQHPTMWQVALGLHAIEFAQTSAISEFYFWFRFRPYHRSRRHSAPVYEILSKSDHPRQKKMTSRRFLRWQISAILDFNGPIMGSSKSPCTSIETMALNCLVFEKITFLYFGNRQTDRRTDGQAWSRSLCCERLLNKREFFL